MKNYSLSSSNEDDVFFTLSFKVTIIMLDALVENMKQCKVHARTKSSTKFILTFWDEHMRFE